MYLSSYNIYHFKNVVSPEWRPAVQADISEGQVAPSMLTETRIPLTIISGYKKLLEYYW